LHTAFHTYEEIMLKVQEGFLEKKNRGIISAAFAN